MHENHVFLSIKSRLDVAVFWPVKKGQKLSLVGKNFENTAPSGEYCQSSRCFNAIGRHGILIWCSSDRLENSYIQFTLDIKKKRDFRACVEENIIFT